MIKIKSTSTLLFAVLLTCWVHFASSQPSSSSSAQDPYTNFLIRLDQAINTPLPDLLPFSLNIDVIENLKLVSDEFKGICLLHDLQLSPGSNYSPEMALSNTINDIFRHYIQSVGGDSRLLRALESIKSMDPIGLHVYLLRNSVSIMKKATHRFSNIIMTFEDITKHRLRLLNMKTNDTYFDIFGERSSGTPFNFLPQRIGIPAAARAEIATEYASLSNATIDLFTNLVTAATSPDLTSHQMYRIGTVDVDDYKEYMGERHDVQILNDMSSPQTSHAICIRYDPQNGSVHVYDSLMRQKLNNRQVAIINKLYPLKRGKINFKALKNSQQQKYPTGAIFAIAYATMLLLGKDPSRTSIQVNTFVGDETVYLRIHILNMLANQDLALEY